ncbi:DUF1838 family protein [Altererythrobacter sp. BO-6]|uniref:DUF1838 family protein n=1 Tax=Altererythrobacter sp. BO-6 TaxID=2604537 RepID=UPI0013E183B5|nr:DUF1838 family protein [Altererythrobacter sp. BO-6]QIG53634.1 DUF1838 family protein [Altererythrobacter sp. BO-6]
MSQNTLGKFVIGMKRSVILAACLFAAACSQGPRELSAEDLEMRRAELDTQLADPVARTRLIAKVFGSTEKMERHAFLKFHVFGFTGEGNLIPFFTMNNYVIQRWSPGKDNSFDVQHFEVAYYSKFDTNEAISEWKNPLTDEVIELPHFVLGPVPRSYSPNMPKDAATFAPDPLNITMIGDRVYIPTLTRLRVPGMLSPEEWGPYGGASENYWDSMLVYSANIDDVLDEKKTHVPAEMHMQNLVSWAPYLKLGNTPGRTMVRAYGQHISGFDALPADIRSNLEKYTPEIFDVDSWKETRIDAVEFMQSLMEKREKGTLDIDQPGYKAPRVKRFDELSDF